MGHTTNIDENNSPQNTHKLGAQEMAQRLGTLALTKFLGLVPRSQSASQRSPTPVTVPLLTSAGTKYTCSDYKYMKAKDSYT